MLTFGRFFPSVCTGTMLKNNAAAEATVMMTVALLGAAVRRDARRSPRPHPRWVLDDLGAARGVTTNLATNQANSRDSAAAREPSFCEGTDFL